MHCQKLFLFSFIPFLILAFISSFDDFLTKFCAPVFVSDMSFSVSDAAAAVAAAATPQNVRLNPFNKDNVHLWFKSHEDEFTTNKIVKSTDKFSLARAKLPKSILDIYSEELDACRDQADAYDALRTFVISQFGKCK